MMTAFASVELAVEAMKLGATDFLRKPMTPEVVRNSVAAALKKTSESQTEVESRSGPPPQQLPRTVTMNRFTILRESDVPRALPHRSNERWFLVRKPNGREQEVVVEISQEAFKEAEQATGGALMEKAFWTSQAETFLSDFIWNDGSVPAGKLTLKGVDRDVLKKELGQQKRSNE
jgi:hypothetical protein